MSYIIRDAKASTYLRRSFFKDKRWTHDFTAFLDFAKKFMTYGEALAKLNQIRSAQPGMLIVIDQV